MFKQIKSISSDQLDVIFDYFEEYFIGKIANLSSIGKQVRRVPRFSIKLWNLYDRLLMDLPRTNNSIEAWHKSSELDVKKHTSFNKLVEHFRKEQKHTHILCAQLIMCGDKVKRKKTEVEKDQQIKSLISNYKKNECLTYLEKIALILN